MMIEPIHRGQSEAGDTVNHSSSPYRGWFLFFCGLCMGVADLVPGISGGTIAFIFGFYHPLLESLKSFNLAAFRSLVQGKWKEFSTRIAWKFLLVLLLGILSAFVCFANFFHYVLSNELYRVYLYGLFFGFILSSFVLCLKQVDVWTLKKISMLCVGAISAYFLTDMTLSPVVQERVPVSYFDGWLFLCGVLAVCALLLPGISGSYVLTLLGVYPVVIEALVEFLRGLASFSWNKEAFIILWSLGLGIIWGGIGCARALSALMRHYPQQSLVLLSGFMIGAIRAVWPFWTYTYAVSSIKPHKGAQLIPEHAYLPSLDSWFTWEVLACVCLGFVFVLALENYVRVQKMTSCKNSP